MIYITLFLASFLAATLLPFGSEALLLYDISQKHSLWLLWLTATTGNTLGSVLNYLLGFKGEAYLERKGYLSEEKMKKSKELFDVYGGWVLFLSWVPIIGDPLTFVAGLLRYNFKWFCFIVFMAKGLRYAVLIYLASSFSASNLSV